MLVVSSVDNVLKPMIISRGSDLPFVLVLLGVFGGVVAFGFIGVFLGPVLLALGFALIKEWAAPAHAHGTTTTAARRGVSELLRFSGQVWQVLRSRRAARK